MILLSIKPVSGAILISTAVIVGLIIIYNFWVMWIASKNIFPGAGAPISMAQTVLNSIQATSQFLFGIFIVAVLLVLIIEEIVTAEVGIPVITSVVGFLLGRTQKKSNDA
ncbi:MAG: hypothetical protein NVV59_17740 [Chitinophagaceae bacterium]|nr:hypothetical protein [Chitinophagaceae bacterium]